jgi:DNA-binding response OmpR family regulator
MNTLFLTEDVQAASKLTQVLQRQSIDVVVCEELSAALRELGRTKYHAVFLDCDAPYATDLLISLRKSPSNKTAVVLAVSGDRTPAEAGDLRTMAQFLIQKPLATSQIESTLRAARGLLLRELRQYYRLPLDAPVTLDIGGRRIRAKTTNVSIGGMGVRSAEPLQSATSVHVRMQLPAGELFESLGEVVWADPQGRVGIHFRDVAPLFQTRLEQWLTLEVDRRFIESEIGGSDAITATGRLD